jgi:hypothetical protein
MDSAESVVHNFLFPFLPGEFGLLFLQCQEIRLAVEHKSAVRRDPPACIRYRFVEKWVTGEMHSSVTGTNIHQGAFPAIP